MSDTYNMNGVLAESKVTHGLDLQGYLQSIVNIEDKRLNAQSTAIDDAYISKTRMMNLDDSYRKRYNQYLKIVIVVILSAFIVFGLYLIQGNFPVIPSIIIDMLAAITLTGALLLILYILFFNIYIRDTVDYDELNPDYLMGNFLIGSGNIIGSGSGSGIKSGVTSASTEKNCVNDSCCDDGTKWCPSSFQCISTDSYNHLCPYNSVVDYNNMITTKGFPGISDVINS